jgi:hypothetical protein
MGAWLDTEKLLRKIPYCCTVKYTYNGALTNEKEDVPLTVASS